ncbi:MAG TPA: hypothetical protein VLN61_02305 [Pseudolabrys sp.]|nr:hypothetical protein [Pseudolabrys sp.]
MAGFPRLALMGGVEIIVEQRPAQQAEAEAIFFLRFYPRGKINGLICDPRRRARALIRRFRSENLASEHLLDGVEGIHELTQFDNTAFVESNEIGEKAE